MNLFDKMQQPGGIKKELPLKPKSTEFFNRVYNKPEEKLETFTETVDLTLFYEVEIEVRGFKYNLNLGDVIKYNLQSLDDFEKGQLVLQLEKISSIRMSIASTIKYLKSRLTTLNIDYRIWKANCSDLAKSEYYEDQLNRKGQGVPAGWLKAPTKDDIIDFILAAPLRQQKYKEYENEIALLNSRIDFLSEVEDILKARAMAIQSINKQEDIRISGDSNV